MYDSASVIMTYQSPMNLLTRLNITWDDKNCTTCTLRDLQKSIELINSHCYVILK